VSAGLNHGIKPVLVFPANAVEPGWQRGAWLIVKERDILATSRKRMT
jgi:hypothetical protein